MWSAISSHHYKVTEAKQLYFHLADRVSLKFSSALNKVLYFKVEANAHTITPHFFRHKVQASFPGNSHETVFIQQIPLTLQDTLVTFKQITLMLVIMHLASKGFQPSQEIFVPELYNKSFLSCEWKRRKRRMDTAWSKHIFRSMCFQDIYSRRNHTSCC